MFMEEILFKRTARKGVRESSPMIMYTYFHEPVREGTGDLSSSLRDSSPEIDVTYSQA